MTNEKIKSTICDSICRHPYRAESQAELDILCEDCVVNKLEASDGDLISRTEAIKALTKCAGVGKRALSVIEELQGVTEKGAER